jgi:hypothetical protein
MRRSRLLGIAAKTAEETISTRILQRFRQSAIAGNYSPELQKKVPAIR